MGNNVLNRSLDQITIIHFHRTCSIIVYLNIFFLNRDRPRFPVNYIMEYGRNSKYYYSKNILVYYIQCTSCCHIIGVSSHPVSTIIVVYE